MAFILIIEFPKGWKKAKGERGKGKTKWDDWLI
jgi:hypothetical protein